VAKATEYIALDYYIACYTKRYGKKPVINRYSARWGFKDMVESIGLERAKEVIEYYCRVGKTPNLQDLFYNFLKVDEAMREAAEDAEHRRLLREKTARRVSEYRG